MSTQRKANGISIKLHIKTFLERDGYEANYVDLKFNLVHLDCVSDTTPSISSMRPRFKQGFKINLEGGLVVNLFELECIYIYIAFV